jgi:hypothetical protein
MKLVTTFFLAHLIFSLFSFQRSILPDVLRWRGPKPPNHPNYLIGAVVVNRFRRRLEPLIYSLSIFCQSLVLFFFKIIPARCRGPILSAKPGLPRQRQFKRFSNELRSNIPWQTNADELQGVSWSSPQQTRIGQKNAWRHDILRFIRSAKSGKTPSRVRRRA